MKKTAAPRHQELRLLELFRRLSPTQRKKVLEELSSIVRIPRSSKSRPDSTVRARKKQSRDQFSQATPAREPFVPNREGFIQKRPGWLKRGEQ